MKRRRRVVEGLCVAGLLWVAAVAAGQVGCSVAFPVDGWAAGGAGGAGGGGAGGGTAGGGSR